MLRFDSESGEEEEFELGEEDPSLILTHDRFPHLFEDFEGFFLTNKVFCGPFVGTEGRVIHLQAVCPDDIIANWWAFKSQARSESTAEISYLTRLRDETLANLEKLRDETSEWQIRWKRSACNAHEPMHKRRKICVFASQI